MTEGRTTSVDGTPIAYEHRGDGPAVVVVDGACCYRSFGPARPLATLLAADHTVYTYDRRGRGASGDTSPYDFQTAIGLPPDVVDGMRQAPFWPALEAVAHTLVYDLTVAEETTVDLARSVTVPTLVIDSEGTTGDLTGWSAALVDALPDGHQVSLAGAWHDVAPEVLAPTLLGFLRS